MTPKVALPSRGKKRRPEEEKPWFKHLLKKRTIIEPIISHLKGDHRENRCRYKGFAGDQINVARAVMAIPRNGCRIPVKEGFEEPVGVGQDKNSEESEKVQPIFPENISESF